MAAIKEIIIYPIKGLKGVSLEEADVEVMGLKDDRRLMLVDEAGLFISQRTHPDLLKFDIDYHDGQITVSIGNERIRLLDKGDFHKINVQIWDHHVDARTLDPSADKWFSKHLNKKVNLVLIPDSTARIKSFQKEPGQSPVSFADGYPILVIGSASLEDLNARLESPVGMNRFRGNIILETILPFEEDRYGDFQLGTSQLRTIKPCARCQVITINPETGQEGKEPLKTLSTYRKDGNKVNFGSNVITQQIGRIRVGDELVHLKN